jgi:four helix bundle protein
MGNFRRLTVYKRASDLSDRVHGLVVTWPSFERWTLGVQLVRACDSVAGNIAEASGRRSIGDERRIILIARGSAFEVEHWLERAMARNLIADRELLEAAQEVSRMLAGVLRARLVLRTEN